jgi:hypothetical protein
MEQHAEALVALLESCLNHNLKPSHKDEDPPHAKISSDIISCIFLVSYQFCMLESFYVNGYDTEGCLKWWLLNTIEVLEYVGTEAV